MKLFLGMLVVSCAAWAQSDRSNGDPSPTAQQQQKQADSARKQHPHSGKPKEQRASVRTKETQGKAPKSKPGEAALRTPSK
jgi:hypothetical protein